jgi:hypothetical protein
MRLRAISKARLGRTGFKMCRAHGCAHKSAICTPTMLFFLDWNVSGQSSRLNRSAVTVSVPRAESGPIFSFYMGKNTPERKDYIMDSLVVPVEE